MTSLLWGLAERTLEVGICLGEGVRKCSFKVSLCDSLRADGRMRNPPSPPVGRGVPHKELLFLPQMALYELGWFCYQKQFPAYQNHISLV